MCQRNSYQVFDRSPISAVTIKVKPAPYRSMNSSTRESFLSDDFGQSLYDVNDFILPAIENSAVTITTRITEIEHVLRPCDSISMRKNTSRTRSIMVVKHRCVHSANCILPPFYRQWTDNVTDHPNYPLCWTRSPDISYKYNFQALHYIIFIKHFVEFPLLSIVRHNLAKDIIKEPYLTDCEFDPEDDPLCPKFRILKILQLVEKDPNEYERMLFYGSLIEIKISWKCDLDRQIEFCKPQYQFQRLDLKPYEENPYEPGSSFLTSRHFFRPHDRELRRVHTNFYNLHIFVSVTGEAGKFDLFQTTTSIGSFLGIFGTGTIVCDLIAAFFTNFKTVKYDSSR